MKQAKLTFAGENITDEVTKALLDITKCINPKTILISRPSQLRKYYEQEERNAEHDKGRNSLM